MDELFREFNNFRNIVQNALAGMGEMLEQEMTRKGLQVEPKPEPSPWGKLPIELFIKRGDEVVKAWATENIDKSINKDNVSYASILEQNGAEVWWFGPRFSKLDKDWWLLCEDQRHGQLHVFKIPARSIELEMLNLRKDNKPCDFDMGFKVGDSSFTDFRRGKLSIGRWFVKSASLGDRILDDEMAKMLLEVYSKRVNSTTRFLQ